MEERIAEAKKEAWLMANVFFLPLSAQAVIAGKGVGSQSGHTLTYDCGAEHQVIMCELSERLFYGNASIISIWFSCCYAFYFV